MDRIDQPADSADQAPEPDQPLMPEISCDACHGGGRVTQLFKRTAGGPDESFERRCALCGGTGQRTAGQ